VSRRFVIVSGLPGSGKSTLGARLAEALALPVIDKDTILEELFEARGIGDASWRRVLSRESDELLRQQAEQSQGAVLVSHWRVPGMPENSGTLADWLPTLAGRVVSVHCECDSDTAAMRFLQRKRHPGHGDAARSRSEIIAGVHELALLGRIALQPQLVINTSAPCALEGLVNDLNALF
jgi:glucokinase